MGASLEWLPSDRATHRELRGYVVLRLLFREQADQTWTGECVELGTATDGPSLSQTHEELVDLVTLHLNALEEAGERDHFFRKYRIRFYAMGERTSIVQLKLPVVDEGVFVHAHKIPLAA